MAERNPQERYEDRSFDIKDIVDVFERWSQSKSNRDIRFTAISRAVRDTLETDPRLVETANHMIRVHQSGISWAEIDDYHNDVLESHYLWQPNRDLSQPDDPPSFSQLPYPEYAANLLHRGLWHEWRQSDELSMGWPDKFDSEEHARAAIEYILSQDELREQFTFNVAWRPIQTSYPDRMLGPLLALRAYQDRFPEGINMMSVGPSWGGGERKMLLGMDFPTPQVYDWYGMDQLLEHRRNLSDRLKNIIGDRPLVKNIFGVDIFPGDLMPEALEWAISSLMPGEQMNKKFMAQIELLKNSSPEKYHPMTADFTNSKMIENLKQKIGHKLDVVLFSTVLYQQSPEGRRRMAENALSVLSKNGLIIVLDFAEHRPFIEPADNPADNLHFPLDWAPWTYRLHVLDPAKSGSSGKKPDFETAMHFDSGRCRRVRFAGDFGNLVFKD
jgi:SAM-dependent methyltransferase